jgi:hypothetical protein
MLTQPWVSLHQIWTQVKRQGSWRAWWDFACLPALVAPAPLPLASVGAASAVGAMAAARQRQRQQRKAPEVTAMSWSPDDRKVMGGQGAAQPHQHLCTANCNLSLQ